MPPGPVARATTRSSPNQLRTVRRTASEPLLARRRPLNTSRRSWTITTDQSEPRCGVESSKLDPEEVAVPLTNSEFGARPRAARGGNARLPARAAAVVRGRDGRRPEREEKRRERDRQEVAAGAPRHVPMGAAGPGGEQSDEGPSTSPRRPRVARPRAPPACGR